MAECSAEELLQLGEVEVFFRSWAFPSTIQVIYLPLASASIQVVITHHLPLAIGCELACSLYDLNIALLPLALLTRVQRPMRTVAWLHWRERLRDRRTHEVLSSCSFHACFMCSHVNVFCA